MTNLKSKLGERPRDLRVQLLATASSALVLVIASSATAQDRASTTSSAKVQKAAETTVGEVTVTGSRIITSNLDSPTPITSVATLEIAKTTPSDIADGLN